MLFFFRNKKEKKFPSLLTLILIVGAGFLFYKTYLSYNSPKQWSIPNQSGTNIKYITEESLITDIKNCNKLIPLELELSETVTIDDSWGSLDLFKKYKKITYVANCSYSIDLSNIKNSDISINSTKQSINLTIPKPKIDSISIDYNKIIYHEAITGLLRFGDLSLSAEEYGVIEQSIKNSISDKMNGSDLYDKACENSIICTKKFLTNILGKDSSINVEVSFNI